MTSLSLRKLGEVVERVTVGHVGPTSDFYVPPGKGVPFLRTQNVGDHAVIRDEIKYVTHEFHQRLGKSTLRAGDLLISRVISDRVRCAVVPVDLDGANCANIVVVRPGTGIDARFIGYYLTSPMGQRSLLRRQVGSAQTVINTGVIHDWEIPVPSIGEQRRIADILDKAESIRRKREEAIALTEDLLEATFLTMFGDPGTNSKGLKTAALGDLGEWRSGGTPPRNRPEYFAGTIPWFSSGELESMYVSESAESVTRSAIDETSAKAVPAGALMLGMYDTAALKAAIAQVNCSCNQAVAFSRLREDICDVVYVYMAVTFGREHFRRLQRGVRQKNLNLAMIRDIRIPLPPLNLQHRFVEIVDAMECQRVQQRAHLSELDRLFGSLQTRAFRGEL